MIVAVFLINLFFLIWAFGFSKSLQDKFLSVFLSLGTAGKIILYLKFDHLIEPVGSFDFSADAFAEVYKVIFWGLAGVLSGSIISELFLGMWRKNKVSSDCDTAPYFYRRHEWKLKILFLFITATVGILNYKYLINIIGLSTGVLNGIGYLIWSWFVAYGVIILSSYILYWDRSESRLQGFLFQILSAFTSTTTRLSRGFVFYIVPQIFVFIQGRGWRRIFCDFWVYVTMLIVCLAFVGNLRAVNYLRVHVFGNVTSVDLGNEIVQSNSHGGGSSILKIVLGRWVGLEGVMSVVAFKDKGMGAFEQIVFNNITPNGASFYDSFIAKTPYVKTNSEMVRFGTLPGLFSFLFVSGSMWILFFGSFILVVVMRVSEFLLERFTVNRFVVSFYSSFAALGIAQFGFMPFRFFQHCLSILIFILAFEYLLTKIGKAEPLMK